MGIRVQNLELRSARSRAQALEGSWDLLLIWQFPKIRGTI